MGAGSEEMLQLERNNTNWYIYNVVGLSIKDSNDWRAKPLFKDSTLVNRKQLIRYLEEINYENDEIRRDIIYGRSMDTPVLIIQNNGIIEKNDEERFNENAERRALEIISLIYFTFLFLSNFKIGICLDFQLIESSRGKKNIVSSYNRIIFYERNFGDEYPIFCPQKPFCFSLTKLKRIFNKSQVKFIYKIVENRSNSLILDSLINFYLSVNVPSPISQLLGSITSMEILLKNDNIYDKLLERIKVMLGEKIYQEYILSQKNEKKEIIKYGVIDKRHVIVHEGSQCNSTDAMRAIILSCYCIIGFSYLIQKFKNKESLCKHLDLLYKVKFDNDLKSGHFFIISKWKKYQFDISLLDIPGIWFIDYFALCSSTKTEIPLGSYAQAIVLYSNYSSLDLELSYKKIKQLHYYNNFAFKSFKNFQEYYEMNKEFIDKLCELFLKRHHYLKF